MMNELVHTHMTKDVITLGPDNTLGEAREIMLKKRIHHLPILDGKTLVGMVTRSEEHTSELQSQR